MNKFDTSGKENLPKPKGYAEQKRLQLAEFFVYAMIFFSPLIAYRAEVFEVNLNPQRLFVLLAVATWVINRFIKRDFSLPYLRPALLPLGAFALLIAYEIAQLPFTRQPSYAYQFVAILVSGFVLVSVMTVVLDRPRKIKIAILTFAASSAIPLGIGVYQSMGRAFGYQPRLPFHEYLSLEDRFLLNLVYRVYGEEIPRISGTLTAPAFYGEYLVFIALFLGIVLIYKKLSILPTLLIGAALSVALFCLLATVSRSAWILAVLGLVSVAVLTRKELAVFFRGKICRWVLPGGVAGIMLLVLVSGYPLGLVLDSSLDSVVPGYTPQFSSQATPPSASGGGQENSAAPSQAPSQATPPPASEGGQENSAASGEEQSGLQKSNNAHLRLREEAVGVFLEHPVFGVGLGNFGAETGQQKGLSSAHAYGFTFLAEGGLIGISVLLLFMGSFVFSARRLLQSAGEDSEWKPYLLWLYLCLGLLALNNLLLYDTLFRDTSFALLGLGLAATNTLFTHKP